MRLNSKLWMRVVCGISGGVDSAVSAGLLQAKGFDVIGVFMRNWDARDEIGTCSEIDAERQDAWNVCSHLGIPFHEVSFVKEYWNDVFTTLLQDYENGLTPNPDVLCNKYIKFGAFYRYAVDKLGADAIATGHYAATNFGPFLEHFRNDTKAELRRPVDKRKDQTLFLSGIDEVVLRRTMFPLGPFLKSHVRRVAEDLKMPDMAKKRDSTGICFIGDRKFSHFIAEYFPKKRGPFIDVDTRKIIAWHDGIHQWTVGQKCNLTENLKKYYVAGLDVPTQSVLAVSDVDHLSLYAKEFIVTRPHWISKDPLLSSHRPYSCMFKFQHAERTHACLLWKTEGGLTVELASPLRALTPGQQAVFYKGEVCLGGAKILSVQIPQLDELKSQCPTIIKTYPGEEQIKPKPRMSWRKRRRRNLMFKDVKVQSN